MPSVDPFQPGPEIERALAQHCAALTLPDNLVRAISYALLGGGKRLRPLLAWHSAAAVGAPGESSLPAGIAVELIHAFSLVHDDLPALDNDDLRRGRPTLHRHSGEAMAILAGDAMLALGFQSLMQASVPAALSAALLRELAAGTMGMIAGQVYDTLGGLDESKPALERVREIHRNKTGALIRASVRMGALCGLSAIDPAPVADDARLAALSRAGDDLGLMFQIVDDLLDVEQTSEAAGKRTGKDRDAGKLTYPGAMGNERARAEVHRLRADAAEALTILGPPAEGLRELVGFLARRTK